jgi:hypothetical protein
MRPKLPRPKSQRLNPRRSQHMPKRPVILWLCIPMSALDCGSPVWTSQIQLAPGIVARCPYLPHACEE